MVKTYLFSPKMKRYGNKKQTINFIAILDTEVGRYICIEHTW